MVKDNHVNNKKGKIISNIRKIIVLAMWRMSRMSKVGISLLMFNSIIIILTFLYVLQWCLNNEDEFQFIGVSYCRMFVMERRYFHVMMWESNKFVQRGQKSFQNGYFSIYQHHTHVNEWRIRWPYAYVNTLWVVPRRKVWSPM